MTRLARWPITHGIQALTALLLLLGLPACSTRAAYFDQYRQDLVLLKQICEQYNAGERIYRTVDGVEGVFQMKARNPYPDWRDQFGLDEPWGVTYEGDWPTFFPHSLGGNRDQYWFYEQQPAWGSPPGSPYRRTFLIRSNQKPTAEELENRWRYLDSEGYVTRSRTSNVTTLLSRYGWTTEDLTTIEMRRHWISGVRQKVFALPDRELLAERIDFYRATGPAAQLSWSSSVACSNPASGYEMANFPSGNNRDFIRRVLKPTTARPTATQLDGLGRN